MEEVGFEDSGEDGRVTHGSRIRPCSVDKEAAFARGGRRVGEENKEGDFKEAEENSEHLDEILHDLSIP